MDVVTPEMKARLVICAATGDVPIKSVLRWLPAGTQVRHVEAIGLAWSARQPGRAWAMANDLVTVGPS